MGPLSQPENSKFPLITNSHLLPSLARERPRFCAFDPVYTPATLTATLPASPSTPGIGGLRRQAGGLLYLLLDFGSQGIFQ